MSSTVFQSSPAAPLRQDARTIALIGLAHGSSHFFHMLLPPLFPAFIRDFGLSYSELGLLVTVFFVISGIGQAMAGFLVDKVGARPVLFLALGCFVVAALAAAGAQGYGGLMLAAALAGLGNSPFHPVDFTILNKRVSAARLGHAFSVHGISGNLGWAAAPVFLAGIAALAGSWRIAYLCAAAYAFVVLLLMVMNRDALDDRAGAWSHEAKPGGAKALAAEHPLAFLKLPSVWLCFAFFFWTTAALSAIQGFAGPALQQMYGLPLAITGLAGPSRDMLIKRAAPPGATGRVYGTVYSGLDIGFALAAPVFGALLDRGHAGGVFQGSALLLLMGIVSAALVGLRVARGGTPAAA